MTAPRGISSALAGGDCRILLPPGLQQKSSSVEASESAVPGGVGSEVSEVEANEVVLTDVDRRCRIEYEADLGSSGLGGGVGESVDKAAEACEDRRLAMGEW